MSIRANRFMDCIRYETGKRNGSAADGRGLPFAGCCEAYSWLAVVPSSALTM